MDKTQGVQRGTFEQQKNTPTELQSASIRVEDRIQDEFAQAEYRSALIEPQSNQEAVAQEKMGAMDLAAYGQHIKTEFRPYGFFVLYDKVEHKIVQQSSCFLMHNHFVVTAAHTIFDLKKGETIVHGGKNLETDYLMLVALLEKEQTIPKWKFSCKVCTSGPQKGIRILDGSVVDVAILKITGRILKKGNQFLVNESDMQGLSDELAKVDTIEACDFDVANQLKEGSTLHLKGFPFQSMDANNDPQQSICIAKGDVLQVWKNQDLNSNTSNKDQKVSESMQIDDIAQDDPVYIEAGTFNFFGSTGGPLLAYVNENKSIDNEKGKEVVVGLLVKGVRNETEVGLHVPIIYAQNLIEMLPDAEKISIFEKFPPRPAPQKVACSARMVQRPPHHLETYTNARPSLTTGPDYRAAPVDQMLQGVPVGGQPDYRSAPVQQLHQTAVATQHYPDRAPPAPIHCVQPSRHFPLTGPGIMRANPPSAPQDRSMKNLHPATGFIAVYEKISGEILRYGSCFFVENPDDPGNKLLVTTRNCLVEVINETDPYKRLNLLMVVATLNGEKVYPTWKFTADLISNFNLNNQRVSKDQNTADVAVLEITGTVRTENNRFIPTPFNNNPQIKQELLDNIKTLEIGDAASLRRGRVVLLMGFPMQSLDSESNPQLSILVGRGKVLEMVPENSMIRYLVTNNFNYRGSAGGPLIEWPTGRVVGVLSKGIGDRTDVGVYESIEPVAKYLNVKKRKPGGSSDQTSRDSELERVQRALERIRVQKEKLESQERELLAYKERLTAQKR
mmetsp:Transcript_8557/g.11229  ORF Transcript_8557/g.11229 Transcript_8557/m.11229 type:complete len:787 (+) Transcript_8557:103-2463(+)